MKKILLSLALANLMFAATSCDKVLGKIDTQIQKAQSAKKVNQLRVNYLNEQKQQISSKCVNGKIDSSVLKQIKTDTKYEYENKVLAEKQAKLDAKKEKVKNDYNKNLDKLKAKEEKEKAKLEKKAEKEKAKADKKAEKEKSKLEKKSEKEKIKVEHKLEKEKAKADKKIKAKLEEK